MKCATCGMEHDVMYVHSVCHPDVPTWTAITTIGDVITSIAITCGECGAHIMELNVAEHG